MLRVRSDTQEQRYRDEKKNHVINIYTETNARTKARTSFLAQGRRARKKERGRTAENQ